MRRNNLADLVSEVDWIEVISADVFDTLLPRTGRPERSVNSAGRAIKCAFSDINLVVNAWQSRGGCAGPVQGRIQSHRGRTLGRASNRTLHQAGALRQMCVGPTRTAALGAPSDLAASASKAATPSSTSDGRAERNVLQRTVAEAMLDAVVDRARPPRVAVTRIQPTLATSGVAP
jgi:hypothetical protein